jgi:hypothetical protein
MTATFSPEGHGHWLEAVVGGRRVAWMAVDGPQDREDARKFRRRHEDLGRVVIEHASKGRNGTEGTQGTNGEEARQLELALL